MRSAVRGSIGDTGANPDIAELPAEQCATAPATVEVDSDYDSQTTLASTVGSGGAGGAPKPQRGSSQQEEKAIRSRSRRGRVPRAGGQRRKPHLRTDSLPRSRLRMNVSPAHLAFRSFAANSIAAASVVSPGGEQLVSTLEEPEEIEPGSRIVSEAEIRAATGAERDG